MAALVKIPSRAEYVYGGKGRRKPPPSWKVQWDVKSTNGKRARRRMHLGPISKREAERFKEQVEALLYEQAFGTKRTTETAAWLARLDEKVLARMRAADLLEAEEAAKPEAHVPTLGELLDRFWRVDLAGKKASTLASYANVRRDLERHFGKDKPLAKIGPAEAAEWRASLLKAVEKAPGERGRTKKLATATISRRVVTAKAFFARAVDWELCQRNAFTKLKTGSQVNKKRLSFVSLEKIRRVLAACPTCEWRLIVALARYGGLRCPSELLALRWSDVHWPQGRFTVHASKTEHHENAGERVVPIFPELLPFLEAQFAEAEPGETYVIRLRDARTGRPIRRTPPPNLSTHLRRIVKKAGLAAWPRLWQQLRASRETELIDEYGIESACTWIGNTPVVAMQSYKSNRFLEDDYEQAAKMPTEDGAYGKNAKRRRGNTHALLSDM